MTRKEELRRSWRNWEKKDPKAYRKFKNWETYRRTKFFLSITAQKESKVTAPTEDDLSPEKVLLIKEIVLKR